MHAIIYCSKCIKGQRPPPPHPGLKVTHGYVLYWVSYVAQTRQDIEKLFSASLKGVENKVFPVKKSAAFKIFIYILCKIRHVCHFCNKKNHF